MVWQIPIPYMAQPKIHQRCRAGRGEQKRAGAADRTVKCCGQTYPDLVTEDSQWNVGYKLHHHANADQIGTEFSSHSHGHGMIGELLAEASGN